MQEHVQIREFSNPRTRNGMNPHAFPGIDASVLINSAFESHIKLHVPAEQRCWVAISLD